MKITKSLFISGLISVLLITLSLSSYLMWTVYGQLTQKLNTLIYIFPALFGIMGIFYLIGFIIYAPILYKMNEYYYLSENGLLSLSLVGAFLIGVLISVISFMLNSDFLRALYIFMTVIFIIPFNVKLFIELRKKSN